MKNTHEQIIDLDGDVALVFGKDGSFRIVTPPINDPRELVPNHAKEAAALAAFWVRNESIVKAWFLASFCTFEQNELLAKMSGDTSTEKH